MEGLTAAITRLIPKDAAIFRQSGRGRFIVIRGPDRGESLLVGQTPVTIGSGSSAEVRLSDPTISRRHLAVTLA
jgi:pSer/pThr/pTyr-binding forkhead associated (FHA) protein